LMTLASADCHRASLSSGVLRATTAVIAACAIAAAT